MTKSYSKRAGQARLAPLSVRFSEEQRARLFRAAGNMPVSAYIKSKLFADGLAPAPTRSRVRTPVKDERALAEVLACLGASRLPNNLNQLARAANSGNLLMDWEVKAQIAGACSDVRVMRQLLMQALGLKVPDEPPAKQSPSQSFTRAGSVR